ncbi:class I SAM-dependent methyltransferase [Phaeacidiphilus oryzae]|jgi:SAM-dependent methyltransferase|uniref:class I SAM-dependent methyltransferase n=1 Tax=Phaeacidiphilus oryzae TaxID=348818 RepID=UPI000567AA44|nr:class I SAM-dependent methyltransferase [Phaeacidiphilus oryzae]
MGDHGDRSFEELVEEAAAVPVDGWDFSWLEGRATEARPSWGYQRLMAGRLADPALRSALDLQTGGGEVLAGADRYPPAMAATEAWPPNLARAGELLIPRGVVVVGAPETGPLPFPDAAFDLVTSRHPARIPWDEIARVLRPGGHYLAQHVGPASGFELIEFLLGPLGEEHRRSRSPEVEAEEARAAGLELTGPPRCERTRIEVFDIGAVVYLLRKLVWWVPGFTVERYEERLRALDAVLRRDGRFTAYSSRTLFEARRPARAGRS